MKSPFGGSQLLLKRLREVLAEPLDAQDRLDRIVSEIADNMVAEVCSVYALRADRVLELFATKGLNLTAVHHSVLRLGQGLVGTIAATARPLNLDEARSHPAFAYLPETGEEIYQSFLGVPLLRAGRSLGVLAVQNRTTRRYGEEEVETLETIAMVIAEMIAAGEFEGLNRTGIDLDLRRPVRISGVSLNGGLGLGHVVLHEPRVVVTNLFNEDIDSEIERLRSALNRLRMSIDRLLDRDDFAGDGEHRDVLDAYRMFADDRGWIRRMEEAILNGLTAEAAVEKVQSENQARMMHHSDPYLRDRLNDFNDLAYRLLRELVGKAATNPLQGCEDAIVVAHNLGASELLDYPRENLRAVVLEYGAPTSHVTIVARALGVPMVGQVAGIVSLTAVGDPVIVDGSAGTVHVRADAEIEEAFREKVRYQAKRQKQYDKLREEASVSKDGTSVALMINAGLEMDLPQIEITGAEGIGLFRTELQFLVRSSLPRAEEQQRLYEQVLGAAAGRPVTFRLLDIGGDKFLPYMRTRHEENPALGIRAVRLALERPGLIRTQLRALLKAAAGRELRILIPMVTDVSEIAEVREFLDHEVELMARFGHALPRILRLGTMIEVPSLLWQLDELCAQSDFLAVGTNDLLQFFMASDRANAHLSERFEPLSLSFMRALSTIVAKADEHDVPVSVCGEMAGRPIQAMALIGLGLRTLSMTPSSIGAVKAMVLELDVPALEREMANCLNGGCQDHTVRARLTKFAEQAAISL